MDMNTARKGKGRRLARLTYRQTRMGDINVPFQVIKKFVLKSRLLADIMCFVMQTLYTQRQPVEHLVLLLNYCLGSLAHACFGHRVTGLTFPTRDCTHSKSTYRGVTGICSSSCCHLYR